MKKYIVCAFIALVASAIAFCIHVASVEWISSFVASTMEGQEVSPSWDVRYIAALTSLETGVSLVVLYALIRKSIPFKTSALKGAFLGMLLLMVQGSFIRQPLMDMIIGNPFKVVLVQDGISWVIWLTISIFVAISYDHFIADKCQANAN